MAVDGILQFAGGAMNTPPDLLLGQGGEPALDQVQPRGAGRREVHMEPRMTGQPAMNRSEEHTSELQSRLHLVCRLLLEKKKKKRQRIINLLDSHENGVNTERDSDVRDR